MSSHDDVSKTVKRLFRALSLEESKIDFKQVQPWVLAPGKTAEHELKVGTFRFDAEKFILLARPHELTRKMTEAEKTVMKDSIYLNGIQTPLYLDVTGRVIDGFHRLLCAAELLIEEGKQASVLVRIVEFSTSDKESEFVILHHLVRRHFTADDKKEMAEKLLRLGHDGTAGCIAELVNLSINTVRPVLEDLIRRGEIHFLEKRRDSRGHYHNQVFPSLKQDEVPRGVRKRNSPENEHHSNQDEDQSAPASRMPDEDSAGLKDMPKAPDTNNACQKSAGADAGTAAGEQLAGEDASCKGEAETQVTEAQPISEYDAIGKVWWEAFGVEPITTVELQEVIDNCDFVGLEAYRGVDAAKLGKALAKMVQSEGGKYLAQSKHVRSGSIYFLRPREWTKQGPK